MYLAFHFHHVLEKLHNLIALAHTPLRMALWLLRVAGWLLNVNSLDDFLDLWHVDYFLLDLWHVHDFFFYFGHVHDFLDYFLLLFFRSFCLLLDRLLVLFFVFHVRISLLRVRRAYDCVDSVAIKHYLHFLHKVF